MYKNNTFGRQNYKKHSHDIYQHLHFSKDKGSLTDFVRISWNVGRNIKKKGQWGYSGSNRLVRLPKPSEWTPSMLFSTPHAPEVIPTPKTREVRAVCR